jgi:FkbM family methyltransferase
MDFIESRAIDVVIDVGANVGQFAQALRNDGYRGRIMSFEPTKSAFELLAQKAASDHNWEAHHCGLGTVAGTAILHASELSVFNSILDLSGVATLHDDRMAVDHTEEIQIYPLDQVAASLSGKLLLKIDTQGYERQVLEGGRQTVSRAAGVLLELPVIHMYSGEWRFHEALRYMSEIGFVPSQIQAVAYHGSDNVSAVDFDCLFRPQGEVDGQEMKPN